MPRCLNIVLFLAIVSMSAGSALAQFSWQSYTSLQSVHDVAIDARGGYWAATSGGAYRVSPATEQYDIYRNIKALSTISLNAVAADPSTGMVAFGGLNGELDLLTASGTWKHSLDINQNEQRRSINKLLFADSLMFIAADYGISVYDPGRFAFVSTCKHLGPVPSESRALSLAVWRGAIYVGTELGAVSTPLSTPNIADSAFWSGIPGIQNQYIKAIGASDNYVYIGTPHGLRAWDGTKLAAVSGPAGDSAAFIVAIIGSGTTVFAATAYSIFQVNDLNSSWAPTTPSSRISSLGYDASGQGLVLGDSTAGLMSIHGSTVHTYAPNSPGGNIFAQLSFDRNGVLWGASAVGTGSGSGIYRFDGTQWKTYSTTSATGTLPSNDVLSISADSLGNIWGGTFGSGMLKLTENGSSASVVQYTHANSPLSPTPPKRPDDTTFVVVGSSMTGARDVQWIVPYYGGGGLIHPQLVAYNPHDTGSYKFYAFVCPSSSFLENWDITIDNAGTKWISPMPDFRIAKQHSGSGVMYFNEGQSLSSTQDDTWGIVGTSLGLRSTDATAVALDNDGELWVGTTTGISIISNPEAVLSSPSSLHIRSPYLSSLNGDNANITSIMVDPLNNKWIGTLTNGLFVVSPDGSELFAHFDQTNSPILDDQINAITLNRKTGQVYVGTKNGLSVVTITGLSQSIGTILKVGPQPYFVPSATPMYIYGVPQDAEVKIFTISGALVRDYQPGDLNVLGSSGGWDGRDTRGDLVASGIYLIAFAQPDGTSQVKKFAVLRR